MIGLYVLFVFVTVVSLVTGFYWRHFHDPFLRRVCETMFIVAAGSTLGLAILMAPEKRIGWLIRFMGRIPELARRWKASSGQSGCIATSRSCSAFHRWPRSAFTASLPLGFS